MTTHQSLGEFTVEQLIDGIKRVGRKLPQLFQEWDSYDEDLLDEWKEQFIWMMDRTIELINDKTIDPVVGSTLIDPLVNMDHELKHYWNVDMQVYLLEIKRI